MKMEVQIKWSHTSVNAGSLVRKEKLPDLNWKEETVLIKRFYGKYQVYKYDFFPKKNTLNLEE